MTTLVSAFVSNVNERYTHATSKYYGFGKLLLESNIPKIIFVDEPMFELIGDNYDNTNTLIIKIEKKDIYLYKYTSVLTEFVINSNNKAKDTKEFMFTMCNKTEWVKEAISLNYFKTDNFVWVDFGIRYIFNCTDEVFIEKINSLISKKYDTVRIATIWNLNNKYNIDIYKDISWYFAGGVFGGFRDNLLTFAQLMKDKCIDIMTKKNTIMWEINIWYLIYMENQHLFDTYKCDHNNTIIDNY